MTPRRTRLALAGGMCLLAIVLAAFAVFDVARDFLTRGDPLWTTVLESAVPLALNATVVYAGYRLYADEATFEDLGAVARWFGGTLLLMGLIMAWVVGFESLQAQYDPLMILTNTMSMGAVAGLGLGVYDLQRRRRAAEVEAERDRVSALFENSTDAVALVEFTGSGVVVTDVNERFEEVFGYDLEDLQEGGVVETLVPEDDPSGEAIRTATRDGERTEREVTRRTADGEREFILRTIPVQRRSTDRREAYAVYTDITERKRRERELREARDDLESAIRRLERSNEELEQFAYIASHDLQEPLRMVSSYMDLLEAEYGDQFDEEAREYIDYAADGATRMQHMIDDLLTFSRVGERNLERETVDADELLEEVLQDLRVRIEETDATVTREELPTVYADRSQLARVFQNLLANALDYAGTEPPEVHVGVETRPDEYVFAVEDEGVGIPADQRDRIFDIFTRGERDDEDGGTGIGLTLCRRIVQAHEGEIWLESEQGEGTVFYFSVSRKRDNV